MLYVPGAEGFRLSELMSVVPCLNHRFNFPHIANVMLQQMRSTKRHCSCVQRTLEDKARKEGQPVESTSHVQHQKEGGVAGAGQTPRRQVDNKKTVWAYEISNVVTAYKWMLNNRSKDYAKCCDAVIVYQLKKSKCLPPGLYVYRRRPRHFGCTVERPIAVVEQFNFSRLSASSDLPNVITINMYPGCDNYSAMYIVTRKHGRLTPEYGNRIFGEAAALGLIEPQSLGNVLASERYGVALRTERMYVLDLRWRGFDTQTACVDAIPKVKGLKAIMWSNHNNNVQDIECRVLSWIFGHSNELPLEVQMVDNTPEALGVRYILLDMETFTGALPQPPREDASFFIHTYFTGDLARATAAVGEFAGSKSRMGSPCRDFDF